MALCTNLFDIKVLGSLEKRLVAIDVVDLVDAKHQCLRTAKEQRPQEVFPVMTAAKPFSGEFE